MQFTVFSQRKSPPEYVQRLVLWEHPDGYMMCLRGNMLATGTYEEMLLYVERCLTPHVEASPHTDTIALQNGHERGA